MSSHQAEVFMTLRDVRKVYRAEAGLFSHSQREIVAVRSVSLDWRRGETYGLVGESGSGKSTLARLMGFLEQPTSGTLSVQPSERPVTRYVFQDPSSSMDPRRTTAQILTWGARYQNGYQGPRMALARARLLMEEVGLNPLDLDKRPGEFSGGQRQRLALARALMSEPLTLICDEIVSALDVSVQGQILRLLLDLKQRHGLGLFFISHDLEVVTYLSDRMGVMYGGQLLEEAPAEVWARGPAHPYSRLLKDPHLADQGDNFSNSETAQTIATAEPRGCSFAGRCPLVQAKCRTETPPWKQIGPEHRAACHLLS